MLSDTQISIIFIAKLKNKMTNIKRTNGIHFKFNLSFTSIDKVLLLYTHKVIHKTDKNKQNLHFTIIKI